MSRIGKKPIQIPQNVTVTVNNGIVTVQGPKGTLTRALNPLVFVTVEDNNVIVDVKNKEEKKERALWGTFAAHLRNMTAGVTTGFKKQLEINGVGYRANMQGKDIKLEVGFSHSVIFNIPEGITAMVEKNVITLEGIDKEILGKVASELRSVKKPEPYKGKGIKYMDEVIRRKAGKAAKS